MSTELELHAQPRTDVGKGASHRLRRQGQVPAVIYGSKKDTENLSIIHKDLLHHLENEAFYSSILTVKIGNRSEQAILRDLQRHPYKREILHMDLLRVSSDVQIRVNIPLHFMNEDTCRGVRQEGGEISHVLTDVEVTCLPKDLPEFIEVDVADLGLGETIHLSDLSLPEGVELTELAHGNDASVVNVHHTRTADTTTEDDEDDTDDEVEEPTE